MNGKNWPKSYFLKAVKEKAQVILGPYISLYKLPKPSLDVFRSQNLPFPKPIFTYPAAMTI